MKLFGLRAVSRLTVIPAALISSDPVLSYSGLLTVRHRFVVAGFLPMYKQLMRVSKGFKLVYIGILLIILGVIGGLLGMCIAGGALGAGAGPGAGVLVMLVAGGMLLCVLTGSIIGLVGRFFCLAVPERAGVAKPLIIISVILELTGMALGVINHVSLLAGRPIVGAGGVGLQGASVLCTLASAVLFLLFTRSLAMFIRRSDLAEAAMLVLWLWVATIACYAAGVGVMMAGAMAGGGGAGVRGGAAIGLAMSLLGLVIAIVALVRYVNLLREMSEATAEFASSGRSTRRSRRKRCREEEEEEEDEGDDRSRRHRHDW